MAEKEYTVVAPDGKEITLIGPVGASQADVIAQAQKLYNPAPQGNVTVSAPTQPVVEEYPQWASTGGGAAVGRPRRIDRTNVQAQPRPLESAMAGITKSFIDPLVAGAQIVTGGNLGTSDLAQRLDQESKVYSEANPMSYMGGRVAGAFLPAAAVAKPIGAIPSFARANPVVQGTALGATSGLMTPVNTGATGAEMYGDVAQNVGFGAGGGAVLGSVPVVADMLRGQKPNPMVLNQVQQARDLGYVIPPTQANPSITNRIIEGISGKVSTAQNASLRNQEVTNRLTAQSLGLPEDTVITPEVLQNLRRTASDSYKNLGLTGRVKTSSKFIQALDEIEPYKNAKAASKDFVSPESQPIIDVIDSLKSPSFDVSSAVSKIALLRNDADKAFRAGDSALGKTNKDASKVLENTIENYLANTKQTDLLQKFKDARQLIAKTYSVEKALNQTTGTVDAKKLAAQLQKGKPLSAELKSVAEFGQTFPKAVQTPEQMGSLPQFSPIDYFAGLIGGGTTGPAGATAALARPALRSMALSQPVQNRLVPSPMNAEQRNLARLLTLQGFQGVTNE
jgi:hypothetical protein